MRENQTLVIEDLTVRNMVRNHRLARAISDAAWRQFRDFLTYKCDWYGRDLVVIDRWYPSSKTCSVCGTVAESMPLGVRTWTCRCGTTHDRDVNAARNILAAGLAVTACGAGVRPQRDTSRTGQPATKQETPGATPGIPRLQAREDVKAGDGSGLTPPPAPVSPGPSPGPPFRATEPLVRSGACRRTAGRRRPPVRAR
ncbi:hypothetical protein GCM10017556_33470 [Micromonospora sagamiensis]|nr:hypothetical protein GCM10017556_33470 [Micromonospora sagamiensis]